MLHFAAPWFFTLFLLIPFLVWRYFANIKSSGFKFPSNSLFSKIPTTLRVKLRHVPFFLRIGIFALLIVALARPQFGSIITETPNSGVDIVLAIDTSGSMHALDFEIGGKRQNRLAVIKKVVEEFVEKRESDRLGMVVFGTDAYTQCPLTLDHNAFLMFLHEIDIGVAGENTAIGSAIAVASQRLKDLPAKSKVIILLTDGTSNAGNISPEVAADAAKALGIKIYTIAVGKNGPVPFPVRDRFFGMETLVNQEFPVDEALLQKIAVSTGGTFFRATDTDELRKIYAEIDKMEKTVVKHKEYANFTDKFTSILLAAFFLLLVEFILRETYLRKIP